MINETTCHDDPTQPEIVTEKEICFMVSLDITDAAVLESLNLSGPVLHCFTLIRPKTQALQVYSASGNKR